MVMGFFALFNCYTLRVNLSVAIVAMVNTTYLRELEAATAGNLTDTDSSDEVCDSGDGSDDNATYVATDMTNFRQVAMSNLTFMTKFIRRLSAYECCRVVSRLTESTVHCTSTALSSTLSVLTTSNTVGLRYQPHASTIHD